MDFTLKIYEELLNTLLKKGYCFFTAEKYFNNNSNDRSPYRQVSQSPSHSVTLSPDRTLTSSIPCLLAIMRHDVDRKPQNSLKTAIIENELGIKASYYFRIKKCSYSKEIITKIAELGHEIGYHYENLATVKGDYKKAIEDFKINLNKFYKYYPVKTICMHGSPLSKYDNKLLWNKYNYRDFDIIGEPYFDIDFNEVFYLTDTGRSWNNSKVSIRDKVKSSYMYNFKSTFEIINFLKSNKLPDKIMIATHPQRWNDKLIPWLVELVLQNLKNIIKKIILSF